MEIACAESSEKFSEFETLSEYLLHDHEKIVEVRTLTPFLFPGIKLFDIF